MALQKITELLEKLRAAYNSGDHSSFVKYFSNPLTVIEDQGNYAVTDTIIMKRLFDTWMHCQEYLDLSTVEIRIKNLQMVSDNVAMISVVWEFLNVNKASEVNLDVSYLVQKKLTDWIIVTILQPTWRYPVQRREDIKELYHYKEEASEDLVKKEKTLR